MLSPIRWPDALLESGWTGNRAAALRVRTTRSASPSRVKMLVRDEECGGNETEKAQCTFYVATVLEYALPRSHRV
jgi:hypothetical protein